jgi:hypothetical protein
MSISLFIRSFIRAETLLNAPLELVMAGYTALITRVTQITAATTSKMVLSTLSMVYPPFL